MKVWQLQDAKNKFSQLVDEAIKDGPKEITRHGKKVAVLISHQDYQKLRKRKTSLMQFFNNSPLKGINLDLKRNKDLPRNIEN